MKFWDSSAIVPLIVEQSCTAKAQSILESDPTMLVWWGSAIECSSAISRLERASLLDANSVVYAFRRLDEILHSWYEINPTPTIREGAIRFLRVHPLRAADSQQLSAAFHAAETRPASLEFVSFDDRLNAAARREGFVVVDQHS